MGATVTPDARPRRTIRQGCRSGATGPGRRTRKFLMLPRCARERRRSGRLVAAAIAQGLMQLQLARAKIVPRQPHQLALGQVDL